MRSISLFISLVVSFAAFSQVGMKQWREHLPYSNVIDVVEGNNQVYAVTPFALISFDKTDRTTERITTINGLSDFGISALSYDPINDWAIIGYENGNIDLIKPNETYNLPAIKNSNVLGSKRINKVRMNDGMAFICTDFGVVTLDIENFEYKEAYYPESTNIVVNDIEFWNDSIYLSTQSGLYRASINNSFLQDFNSWSIFQLPFNINDSTILGNIRKFNDRFFLVQEGQYFNGDTLWYHDGINWFIYLDYYSENIIDIDVKENELYITLIYNARLYNNLYEQIENIYQFTFGPTDLNTFTKDDEGLYWLADKNFGLVSAQNSFASEPRSPSGPSLSGAYKLDYVGGKVALAAGALTGNGAGTFSRSGFHVFEEEEWKSFTYMNQPLMDFDSTFDFSAVAIDPVDNNRIFAGSNSFRGIFEVLDGETVTNRYDDSNSTIQEQFDRPGFYNINDMQVEDNQVLWVANGNVSEPLLAMDVEGLWFSYNIGLQAINRRVTKVYIDFFKNKWLTVRNYGLIAFNENGTLQDKSDDELAGFTDQQGLGNLPSKTVNDLVMDFNNHLWIGTDNGLVVLYNVAGIYENNVDAQRILIDDGVNIEALLGGVDISCIDVDGANRKWIGTNGSGVFCLSPDGSEELYRFTVNNSPLLSNSILDLRINHETGEVFFATENGLISFRADATYGDFEFSNVIAFPNPVHPHYSGPVSIQGVAFNSDVKIMDSSGRMVFQTTSNGGTIVWDGKLPDGNRAATGVYIVLVGEKNNKGRVATKILFIN